MSKNIFFVALFFFCLFIAGCGSPTLNALTDAAQLLVKKSNQDKQLTQAQAGTQKNVQYLKVKLGSQEALMVLGYVDHTSKGTPTEVWYSAGGEILRLQNGLFSGLSGAEPEWLNVQFDNIPSWATEEPSEFIRQYDTMPNYRYGSQEKVARRLIPCDTLPIHLNQADIRCYAESSFNLKISKNPLHAWYIVKQAHVIAAEQCLTEERCLQWQRPDVLLDTP